MASVKAQVSAQEWEARVELAALYRQVAVHGWDDLVFTHLSLRVPGPEHHFLINPYGMFFDEITASSLVKIDLEANIILDVGYPVNPAGFTIHSAIHQVADHHRCVMHLHTIDGTAVATHPEGLLPLNQTAMLVADQLAFHDYEGVALDLDERERLVADLGDKPMMMLRNHGTLTTGGTVAEAYTRMYFLERACSMQVQTLAQGVEPLYPSDESIKKTFDLGLGLHLSGDPLIWPGVRRQLDRLDPSYKS